MLKGTDATNYRESKLIKDKTIHIKARASNIFIIKFLIFI